MKLFFKNKNKQGFAMIEVIVSIGIISILIVAFEGLVFQSIKMNRNNEHEFQANMYLRETIEIAKDLEQSNWEELSLGCNEELNNPCYPTTEETVEGIVWKLDSGKQIQGDGYIRYIYIESACRDEEGFPYSDIVDCDVGGMPHADTKKVKAVISWDNESESRNLETYVYK